MNRPVASTRVLITGPETTVGSILRREAMRGSRAPIELAHTTIARMESETVSARPGVDPQLSGS